MLGLFTKRETSLRLRQLKTLALFSDLSLREMQVVHAFMHERHYLKEEVIVDEGEDGLAIYFILEGSVAIARRGQQEKPLAVLGQGSSFGEMALLDNFPRSAQARAVENCTLAVFFRGDFEKLIHSHAAIASKIALQLARQLGHRLRMALEAEGKPA